MVQGLVDNIPLIKCKIIGRTVTGSDCSRSYLDVMNTHTHTHNFCLSCNLCLVLRSRPTFPPQNLHIPSLSTNTQHPSSVSAALHNSTSLPTKQFIILLHFPPRKTMIDDYEPPPPVYITRFTAPKPTQTTVRNPVPAKNTNLLTGSSDPDHPPLSQGRITSPNTHRARRRPDRGSVPRRRVRGTDTPELKENGLKRAEAAIPTEDAPERSPSPS